MKFPFALIILIPVLLVACAPAPNTGGAAANPIVIRTPIPHPTPSPISPTATIIPPSPASNMGGITAPLLHPSPSPNPPTATFAPLPSPTFDPTEAAFTTNDLLKQYPLITGTTWVYSYIPYEGAIGDPARIVTATYLITETVVRTENVVPSQPLVIGHTRGFVAPYLAVLVRHARGFVTENPDYVDTESNPNYDNWLALQDNKIFQLDGEPSASKSWLTPPSLAFDFPLQVGKNWCPDNPPPAYNPQCEAMGRRLVLQSQAMTTPAGQFNDCYMVIEYVNSGGVTNWVCTGIGIVAAKYDHGGTPFGFEQTLIRFSKGAHP